MNRLLARAIAQIPPVLFRAWLEAVTTIEKIANFSLRAGADRYIAAEVAALARRVILTVVGADRAGSPPFILIRLYADQEAL
jgi:hypothetical protein